MPDNYHSELERLVEKLHDQNMIMKEVLFELKDIRHTLKTRLPEEPLPRIVRKPWYEIATR